MEGGERERENTHTPLSHKRGLHERERAPLSLFSSLLFFLFIDFFQTNIYFSMTF